MCYIGAGRPANNPYAKVLPVQSSYTNGKTPSVEPPHLQSPMPYLQTRAEMDDGATVSELSELEAQALCAREGIALFWPTPRA